jgi:hypothetical protein
LFLRKGGEHRSVPVLQKALSMLTREQMKKWQLSIWPDIRGAPTRKVAGGPIATLEIAVEVKILAKAMIQQIDGVINDLRNQVAQFRRGGGQPVCVGIVGINGAAHPVSYEGDRPYPTAGKGGVLHPLQEAPEPSGACVFKQPQSLAGFSCRDSKQPTSHRSRSIG